MSEKQSKIIRIAIIAVSVLVILGGLWYWHASGIESTDDAFIDAHIIPISPKVSGQIMKVYVNDNQPVKAGDPLYDIDDRDYAVKLAEQRGKLAQTEAEATRAAKDAKRYEEIFKKGEVSHQQLDRAVAEAATTSANLETQKAVVQRAELDLSYTKVTAPDSGRITKKSVEAGAYVQVGQVLMSIVPDQVWVTANYKETQITHIRAGQSVTIKVDTYDGVKFKGHVDSIQAGTGERFSLLPPENATGNYVKVVQRVPVKIVFDDDPGKDYLLAPGMSVVPSIAIK
jgi:membrane fusion protein (multidrug efflux system)